MSRHNVVSRRSSFNMTLFRCCVPTWNVVAPFIYGVPKGSKASYRYTDNFLFYFIYLFFFLVFFFYQWSAKFHQCNVIFCQYTAKIYQCRDTAAFDPIGTPYLYTVLSFSFEFSPASPANNEITHFFLFSFFLSYA